MKIRSSFGFIGNPASAQSVECRRVEGGFTLVEILVAIVILAFGMLGTVGMQAFALQANRDARLQAQAVVYARELAEMMRGNKEIAVKTTAAANPYLVTSMTMSSPSYCMSVSNASTGCTSTLDVAAAEMTDWLARVAADLPDARVTVCFDGTPYDSSGLPQWTCNATGADEIVFIKIGWTRTVTDKSQTGSAALERASDSASRPYVVVPVTSGNVT
ncbi:MAG: type IV pilus modification protein PilV [Acidovorax sp. SCN 65-28]|uniref:type IV pilus modification protein PilV n=1 Tax=Acidovorax sp. TaxID=1872122 RepID=UPI00086CAD4F|nr:type IV pilus modification protein PilV [Acidovorax sp.]MBN9628503.1 type IV pilus modification protein PilV [Acidovorax sp.]ODS78493.1 MAG: type IV pilus modification protein PilV [Acidovorax sp. SCN 65-28]